MATASLHPGYTGPVRDRVENFNGAQLVYVHWEEHLNFCSAITLPLPPQTPFAALTGEILPSLYAVDPEWAEVDLSKARWMLDGADWTPDPALLLADQGVGHKSLIRFWTGPSATA